MKQSRRNFIRTDSLAAIAGLTVINTTFAVIDRQPFAKKK